MDDKVSSDDFDKIEKTMRSEERRVGKEWGERCVGEECRKRKENTVCGS